jgi:uncharacterized repeat protein (TIGR03803 family)
MSSLSDCESDFARKIVTFRPATGGEDLMLRAIRWSWPMPRPFAWLVTTVVALGVLSSARVVQGQVAFDVLYSFTNTPDGSLPKGDLIQATDGNFYGTTKFGGSASLGTVFQMTPDGTETILHSFTGGSSDGAYPSAGLIQGTDGNFYGTTAAGGSANFGTVFRVTPDGTETILHSFTGGGSDGAIPFAALIQGIDGNLYGTTTAGGSASLGTVFQVTPDGTETILHSFTGGSLDGNDPRATLLQASDGNFYGTTFRGGSSNLGTIFQVTFDGTETILHVFGGLDGAHPEAALIQATDGTLYGTTDEGGRGAGGTVLRLIP